MKQVFKLVNLFLVVLLVSFTSCTNDLAPKTTDFNFSFTLPQYDINPRSSTESTSNQISDLQKWIINAQIETSEKVLQNITQEGTSGQTITIHFENIQVSQNVRIDIELTPKGEEKPSYKGTSEWFITKKGSNKIHITLKKIQYEIIPDDDNDTDTDDKPEIIIDAAVPQIIKQPENVIKIVTENSGEPIPMPISVTVQSTDNGTLSFVWQEKNVDNIWENSTINSTDDKTKSSIMVDVYKGDSRTFKCIITNTNDSVNGNKTATIETNEVTVAYVEGQLASIKAQYIGEYEKFNYEDFYSNGKVTVTETYTNGNIPTEVKVTADESRYTISPSDDSEKAIGYVPYTVKYNGNTNISTEIRVPVKYELNANDFIIKSYTNDDEYIGYSEDNPEKIPQFTGQTVLTVGSKGETSEVPTKIYQDTNSDSSSDYEIMTSGVTSSWKKDSSAYDNTTSSISVDNRNQGNSTYNATITPISNSWCVGNSLTLNYYVQVCPWEIALNTEDGNTVDLNILTGGTNYTLSAKNEALEATTTTDITWESSEQNTFIISDGKLTTPEATTSDQTATITAKVDGTEIGTLNVTVQKQEPLGSEGNPFTQWSDLKSYLEATTSEATIYVSGNFEATSGITVNRPVTIIPVGEVNITLDANLSDTLFNVQADFTIRGNASTNFIIYGDNNEFEYPLISTDNSDITLEYVTMQSYTNSSQDSSNPEGGAISFNCAGKTLSLINCNFTNVITNIEPNEDFQTQIGAIYFGNGYLILDNCSFTNASPDYVDLYCSPDDTSKITLKGNITLPIIQYANTNSNGDLQITLDDSTFNSENIQIYVDNISDGYDTDLFTLNNGQFLPNYFTLLNEGYEFDYTNGIIVEKTTGGNGGGGTTTLEGPKVTSLTQLKTEITNGTPIIIIGSNITITEEIDISTPVQIAANSDVTITSNLETEFMFYLRSDLTLGGGSGTLTITGPNHEIALIGTDSATKTITINNGVKFTNCSYYCLSLTGKDTLEINGGEFSSNTMAPIAIASSNTSAVINMSGGKIENNSATNIAAGIVVNNGTLNITGGTLQNNKLNETDSGASIYVSTYGNATIEQTNTTLSKNAHYKKAIINGVEQ